MTAMAGTNDPGATGKRVRRASFPVARIVGIEIRVHLTFLLLVALFAYAGPEAGFGSAWQAVLWLLAIFGCVLVHEFAHSLVARRRGGEVREILLLPLGGVSKLEHLPERPADEFAIAIVGPLASFALAAAAAVGCALTGRDLLPVDLIGGAWLARLAWLNLLLGMFNLLPAFPLDSGRVFRSILERRHDLETATRIATRVGHTFAIGLVTIGILFDPWLVFIGVFVYFGASAEEKATIIHLRLRGHRVRDVMRTYLDQVVPRPNIGEHVLAPDDLLSDEMVASVLESPDRQLAVVADGALVGVVRIEDIERLVHAGPTGVADPDSAR